MTKTNEELSSLKLEYETLKAKLKELTEDELNTVTGGDIDSDSNLHFISPELEILSSEGICKPNCIKVSKEINGKPYIEKVTVCSDLLLKGSKTECVNCPANKGSII